jgi:hypothetical protein
MLVVLVELRDLLEQRGLGLGRTVHIQPAPTIRRRHQLAEALLRERRRKRGGRGVREG